MRTHALALVLSLTAAAPAAPVPVMDLHSDILLRAMDNGIDLVDGAGWTQANAAHLVAGGVTDQVWAVWIDSTELEGLEAAHRALQIIDLFRVQAARHADVFALARSAAHAREIEASGRVAIWLWMEGGAPIVDDLAMLRTYHRLGITGMTLTWMNNLSWAGASTASPEEQMGLTDFGREVVREMNRLGMVIDLSHVSDQTFHDTLAITTDPVVISHSCCRALCDHPRNVSDDMLRALAANGGVIGINAYSGYLSDTWSDAREIAEHAASPEIERLRGSASRRSPEFRAARGRLIDAHMPPGTAVTIDTYLDHLMHAVEVAGPGHVALGSDFDGVWALPQGLENASRWQAVAEGLRARGLTESQVRGIMRENALRVVAQVIDN